MLIRVFFFSLIKLYISSDNIIFFMNKFKKCSFQWLRSFRFNHDCLFSKWRRKVEKQYQVKCLTEKSVSRLKNWETHFTEYWKTNKRFHSDHSIHLSIGWLPHSWFKSYVFHIVFWPCELIFSANRTFVADEILTCQTVKCPENTYLGSTHVIFSVLNGQLKNKWLQTKTVTLTFSANWIVRG